KYVGAMKVTSIRSDAPQFGVEVGDIVMTMNVRGLPAILGVTLQILRGPDLTPVTANFPARPAADVHLERPKLDPTTAAAIRDKLRERVEFLRRGYQAGELPYTELIKAEVDFADAEAAAATNGAERKEAKKLKVDLLTETLNVAQRLLRAGE